MSQPGKSPPRSVAETMARLFLLGPSPCFSISALFYMSAWKEPLQEMPKGIEMLVFGYLG